MVYFEEFYSLFLPAFCIPVSVISLMACVLHIFRNIKICTLVIPYLTTHPFQGKKLTICEMC